MICFLKEYGNTRKVCTQVKSKEYGIVNMQTGLRMGNEMTVFRVEISFF